MTDTEVRKDEIVTLDGVKQSVVSTTTQTKVDPANGERISRRTTRVLSGQAEGPEIVWLIAAVVLGILSLDFIFHALGAHDVGFAAFVYAVGAFVAAPFNGIFNTSHATPGNLVVWDDALGIIIYSLLATLAAKVVALVAAHDHGDTEA